MVLRTAKTGKNAGNQFWGCSDYPDCKGVVEALKRLVQFSGFFAAFRAFSGRKNVLTLWRKIYAQHSHNNLRRHLADNP